MRWIILFQLTIVKSAIGEKYLRRSNYYSNSSVVEMTDLNTTKSVKPPHTSINASIPLIFFFTTFVNFCDRAIPAYFEFTLRQASLVAEDNLQVVLISNFKECYRITNSTSGTESAQNIDNVIWIDTEDIESNRTKHFVNISRILYSEHPPSNAAHYNGGLWVTSTTRFFYIEDFMIMYNISKAVHVEGDNMIYGPWHHQIIPILQKHYKGIAATKVNHYTITASVLWINSLWALRQFTDALFGIALKGEEWMQYESYLKKFHWFNTATQKFKPATINEMTMLAYFASKENTTLEVLPTIPNSNSNNISSPFHVGIWDPASWGQFAGGDLKRRKPGFIDGSHEVGATIIRLNCTLKMLCDVFTELKVLTNSRCYTAPFVRCGLWNLTTHLPPIDHQSYIWHPLYNLHVHSKNTKQFLSEPCPCNTTYGL